MEDRGGFEEDGSMEDAMAEQEELESRVSAIFIGYLLSHCIALRDILDDDNDSIWQVMTSTSLMIHDMM